MEWLDDIATGTWRAADISLGPSECQYFFLSVVRARLTFLLRISSSYVYIGVPSSFTGGVSVTRRDLA